MSTTLSVLSPPVQRSVLCLNWHSSRAAVAHQALVLEAQIAADWALARMVTTTGPCR